MNPTAIFTILACMCLLGSCAPRSHPSIPPADKPIAVAPVAPVTKKAIKPVDDAASQNTEARAHVGQLRREVDDAQAQAKNAQDQLAKLQKQGRADQNELNSLRTAWDALTRNMGSLKLHADTLEATLVNQAVGLKEAKDVLTEALEAAAKADQAAESNARNLNAAHKALTKLEDANDKYLASAAASEARATVYVKWLTILACIVVLYVGLRVCKLMPNIRPFLFWVP